MDSRNMYACLLEHPPMQHGHLAAPSVRTLPCLALEPSGGALARLPLILELHGLEVRADAVAQGLEPGAGAALLVLEIGGKGHDRASNAPVCLLASPTIRVAASATL